MISKVELELGAPREIHWHDNADEWQYDLPGRVSATVFAASANSRTFDFQARDEGAVPFALARDIEKTGTEPPRFLTVFASDRFTDVSLKQWPALTPHQLVAAHLKAPQTLTGALPAEKRSAVPGKQV